MCVVTGRNISIHCRESKTFDAATLIFSNNCGELQVQAFMRETHFQKAKVHYCHKEKGAEFICCSGYYFFIENGIITNEVSNPTDFLGDNFLSSDSTKEFNFSSPGKGTFKVSLTENGGVKLEACINTLNMSRIRDAIGIPRNMGFGFEEVQQAKKAEEAILKLLLDYSFVETDVDPSKFKITREVPDDEKRLYKQRIRIQKGA